MMDQTSASKIAQKYFRSTKPLVRLGWGISGFVYLSPDANTAVKIYHRRESFATELEAYRKLSELKISRIHGLEIPVLRGFNQALAILRMDVVSPPYLLDFAGVTFSPPDFTDDVLESWRNGIEEQFAPNASIAFEVYETLAQYNIYYMDFRPSNMNLKGLPGLKVAEPESTSADDEFP